MTIRFNFTEREFRRVFEDIKYRYDFENGTYYLVLGSSEFRLKFKPED
jgi:hypothetical protein